MTRACKLMETPLTEKTNIFLQGESVRSFFSYSITPDVFWCHWAFPNAFLPLSCDPVPFIATMLALVAPPCKPGHQKLDHRL